MFLKIGRYCVRGEKQPVIAELIFLSVDVKAATKTRESRVLLLLREENSCKRTRILPLIKKLEENPEKKGMW